VFDIFGHTGGGRRRIGIAERLEIFANGLRASASGFGVGEQADAVGAGNALHAGLRCYERFEDLQVSQHGSRKD
jgi:hypothetical protein